MPLLPVLSKGLAQPAGSPKRRTITDIRVCQIHGQLKRHLREQLRVGEQLLSEVA